MHRDGVVVVGVKVEPTIKRQLSELARTGERTLSGEIRLALRRHVESETSIHDGAHATLGTAA